MNLRQIEELIERLENLKIELEDLEVPFLCEPALKEVGK